MRRLTRYGVILTAGLSRPAAAPVPVPVPSGSSSGNASTTSVLTISNENGALWTCGFNPLNSSYNLLSVGFTYEPLVYVNPLQNGKTTPMLATSWSWGAGNKSLTFTIRQGVKWSDGTPLTAADVAYTFNLIKKYPALDLTGVWSVLSSVTATGPYTVTMDFSSVAVPYFYYIADQTPIVPQHIWSTIANPATASISHPIGTGPYLMSKCSPQNITSTADPRFWQPGLPRIHTSVPGLHEQRHGQRRAGERPGPVGCPVHPGHRGLLHLQEPELPLLVPADPERDDGPEPDQPAAEQRQGPRGDLVRDRQE